MLLVLIICGLTTLLIYFVVLTAIRERFFNPRRDYIQRWMDPNQSRLMETGAVGVEKKDYEDEIKMLQGFFGKKAQWRNFYQALRQIDPRLTIWRFLFIVVLISLAITAFFAVVTQLPIYAALFLGFLVGFILPWMYVMFQYKRRLSKFAEHLPDALRIMIGGLKAGYGISGGFEMVGQDGPIPVNQEFRIVLAEMELGLSVEVALQNLVERVKTRDTEFFCMAIAMQKETGGNLAELMENLEKTIRERQRITREAKTLLAQSKMSGLFLVIIPLAIGFAIIHMNVQFGQVLLNTPPGRMALLICGTLYVFGLLLMRKVLDVPLY
jgi:tight adherence protein B